MANCRMPNKELYDIEYNNNMNCIPQEMMIKNVRLAAAYVPYQFMCSLYSPMDSLIKGTAFPELFSPYLGANKNYSCQEKEGLY